MTAESDVERTSRVLAAQDRWVADRLNRDPEPWSPESVTREILLNPATRMGPLGQALAVHGPPQVECRGPGDRQYGPLEAAFLERERLARLRAEIRMSPPGTLSAEAWRLMGATPPAGAPEIRRPVNPFGGG